MGLHKGSGASLLLLPLINPVAKPSPPPLPPRPIPQPGVEFGRGGSERMGGGDARRPYRDTGGITTSHLITVGAHKGGIQGPHMLACREGVGVGVEAVWVPRRPSAINKRGGEGRSGGGVKSGHTCYARR